MAAEDELAIPEIPEAKPDDPEDVSWALSTAEAMWARGDNLEGIKWVRKAAEAASDAENDERALELAKAASELASLIARKSRASINEGRNEGRPSNEESSPRPRGESPPSPTSSHPATARSGSNMPPPNPPSRPPTSKSGAPSPRSVPPAPIPLPSRASAFPKAPAPQASRAAPRPLATNDARQGPATGRGILTNRTEPEAPKTSRPRRRSRENLEAEAKAAGVLDTAPHSAVDSVNAERALRGEVTAVMTGGAAEAVVAGARARRRRGSEPDPTVVGHRDELLRAEREKSAEEWDASPTQNLTGEEMDLMNSEGDRKTAFAMPGARPASVPPAARPTVATVHDPEIQTSQAVRVVVWRDGTGVHIAPAGTVVSSITIDAVLVVLEPSADLTAWLSQRER